MSPSPLAAIGFDTRSASRRDGVRRASTWSFGINRLRIGGRTICEGYMSAETSTFLSLFRAMESNTSTVVATASRRY